ncbi:Membrane protease YdiL, CAAX protease family [Mucilaginibacter mallensis]|uniref:Membrane protease YdiL, CAAX protease family n=1 Tax=Mucilaginibacter mallensis TaxID=652787 RepID=A0A1H2A5Q3_MUCMA|nr:type II CAAX endopeptidase family protein [Mucilaginibacter mallensis]SDT41295.1 Membrane protease YdiL, CAAX protease family [Mucilaginibacter mallensis]
MPEPIRTDDIPDGITIHIDEKVNIRRFNTLMISGIALAIMLYPFLSLLFLSPMQDLLYRLIFSRFLIWAVLGILYLYARYGEMQPFLLWKEEKYDALFYIKAIVGVYLLCFASALAAHIPAWLGLHENNSILHKMGVIMQQYPVLLVFAAITAGITEELVFRGYILSRLSLFFKNRHWPVLISAALFSFMHLGYKTVSELLFSFLIGVVMAYHYQKYRNIKVVIIVHFLVDVIAMSLFRGHR